MNKKTIKNNVREGYAKIATDSLSSCCSCGSSTAEELSKNIGYNEAEITSVPEGANLGLGCGNPTALASLKEGEVVLDLGSGGGFDSFLAAKKVGPTGRVIGVDMTPEMIEKAKRNAAKGNYSNVEFRLGEIEKLPVDDESVDVIISNCVINLSPEKKNVFAEAFRVLKPGGRFLISDIVLTKELPEFIRNSVEAYTGCLAGAIGKDEYLKTVKAAGFENVEVISETSFGIESWINDPIAQSIVDKVKLSAKELKEISEASVASIKLAARKSRGEL